MVSVPSLHRSLLEPSRFHLSSSFASSKSFMQSLCFPAINTKPISLCSYKPLSIKFSSNTPAFESDPDSDRIRPVSSLKIAIIGFGNYGQFLAKTLVSQGHQVLAHSRSDYSQLQVLKSLPLQRLKRSTLFVDVLSVKEFAKNLLLDILPLDFDIICSHPMFGPQSAKQSWKDLFFVYEKVRIGNESSRIQRCEEFLAIFQSKGCKMMEMDCVEHDKFAAGSQFMTHTIGRVLNMYGVESTPINKKGYEALLDLVENTCGDSFDLYYGLFLYNKSALAMVEKLDLAFDALRNELFGRLHHVVRKQLFEKGEKGKSLTELNYQNGAALAPSSNALR